MRSSAKIFYGITVFYVVAGVLYMWITAHSSDAGNIKGLEWFGAVAMVFSALLTLMLGAYFHFTERRMDVLPHDWEEAEIEDGAGMLGFFSPSSIWPAVMTLAVAILAFGIVYMAYWLLLLGAVVLIWSTVMLNLQYGVPKEKH
ncbi:MAG: cytochrome c oxidase subunit 4 [Corynebacterium sp.]|nr:cytochrome c oxidase subunit 4 [Corynebacterium sp.]